MKHALMQNVCGAVSALALCMLSSSCDAVRTPTADRSLLSASSNQSDSLRDVPAAEVGLPPRPRLLDTDDSVLERSVAATQGLAFVAFKSPLSARTFEAAGHRAPVPSAVVRQGLEMLRSSGIEVLNVYRNLAMAYVRLKPGVPAALRHDPLVDLVEPLPDGRTLDQPTQLPAAAGAPLRVLQHVDSVQYVPWNVSFVRAPAAWPYARGSAPTIMLLGYGIAAHEDNPAVPSGNCGGWFNPCSTVWPNGTAELGVIAAQDNSFGVEGVAPSVQGAHVYVWRAVKDDGYIDWNTYFAGYDAAVSLHAWTVLVDFQHTDYVASEAYNVATLWSWADIVVSGVGSDGQYFSAVYPPSYLNVVGVSGVRSDSSFAAAPVTGCTWGGATGSNYGPMVTVAAPFWATTTINYSDGSSGYGNTRSNWSWCDVRLSAAHVAGVIVLIEDRFPTDPAASIIYRLTSTGSHSSSRDNYVGYGIPNAGAAVLASGPPPPPPPSLSVAIDGPNRVPARRSCTWTASASGGTAPYAYAWTVNGNPAGDDSDTLTITTPSSAFTIGVSATDANSLHATSSLSVSIGGISCQY
jgi:hypothetical protein